MKALAARLLIRLIVPLVCAPSILAQSATAQAQSPYGQHELDQMLAPIALYPDPLLSQILTASTYPLEVVQAARWSRKNPGLRGDEAVQAVEGERWDPSVQSLVAFPEILALMDEKPEWTDALGRAFLAQERQVMDTIQALRQRAAAAGNLRSDERLRVVEDGETVVIEPANPRVVYVPFYDPWVVYGPWWWPSSPPVYWVPWPGYRFRPGVSVAFTWGTGIAIPAHRFSFAFDWAHRRCIRVVHAGVPRVRDGFLRPPVTHPRLTPTQIPSVSAAWRPDPTHRQGVLHGGHAVQSRFAPVAPVRAREPGDRADRRHEARRPAGSDEINAPRESGSHPHHARLAKDPGRAGSLSETRRIPPAFRASPR